jgi:hypothetical protein
MTRLNASNELLNDTHVTLAGGVWDPDHPKAVLSKPKPPENQMDFEWYRNIFPKNEKILGRSLGSFSQNFKLSVRTYNLRHFSETAILYSETKHRLKTGLLLISRLPVSDLQCDASSFRNYPLLSPHQNCWDNVLAISYRTVFMMTIWNSFWGLQMDETIETVEWYLRHTLPPYTGITCTCRHGACVTIGTMAPYFTNCVGIDSWHQGPIPCSPFNSICKDHE